jgi:hypothetical protein
MTADRCARPKTRTKIKEKKHECMTAWMHDLTTDRVQQTAKNRETELRRNGETELLVKISLAFRRRR